VSPLFGLPTSSQEAGCDSSSSIVAKRGAETDRQTAVSSSPRYTVLWDVLAIRSDCHRPLTAQVGISPKTRLHDLRQAVATTVLAQNALSIASGILGHSNQAFTMSVYQHFLDNMGKRRKNGHRRRAGRRSSAECWHEGRRRGRLNACSPLKPQVDSPTGR
jgi:hypothetical protein